MTGNIETVAVVMPEESNVILAQSHFIKTAEDIYEALIASVPQIRFGIAFNEASGPALVRTEGNDSELIDAAAGNAMAIGAGHLLVIIVRNAFPINVMSALKAVPELTTVYCATSNPLKAVVMREGGAAGLLGVMDGLSPSGIEKEQDKRERHEFLRKIGYKK